MNLEVFAIYDLTLHRYLATRRKTRGSGRDIDPFSLDISGARLFHKAENAKKAYAYYKKTLGSSSEVIIERFRVEYSYIGNVPV